MIEDAELLEQQLSVAQARVSAQKARLRRHENALLAAVNALQRGQANNNITQAIKAIAKAQGKVRTLQTQLNRARDLEDAAMRDDQSTATTLVSPGPHFALTVCKSGGLRIGDQSFRNGAEVSPELIAGCANADTLLRNYLRWRPRSQLFPAPKTPPPRPAAPPAAVETPMDIFRREIVRVAAQRGCKPTEVKPDWINDDIKMRAFKADTDEPKMIVDGGWGSGSPQQVRSGVGSHRRIPDWEGFIRRAYEGLPA